MKLFIRSLKQQLDEELFHLPDSPRRQLTLLLTALGVGMIGGLALPFPYFSVLWTAGIALIVIGRLQKKTAWSLMAVGMVLIGLSRGTDTGIMRQEIHGLVGTEAVMTGTVSNFGRESVASWSFAVTMDSLNGKPTSFPLRVTSPQSMERGSHIRLSCKLIEQGAGWQCRGGTIEKLEEPGSVYSVLNRIRKLTYEKIAIQLSPDRAALLAGMVYGGDETLPKQTRDDFRASGLSHLIAVSGANLALVTVVLYGFLTAFWLRRKKAAAVTLAVLGVTVVFVGLDPSVVRAGIMGSLILIGYLLGRQRSSGNALLFAAMVMIFLDPWLVFDLGFLLSFSATAGLMFLSSPIEERLNFIPEFGGVRGAVALALSAWLSTIPVLALVLGSVQVISPIANVFAAPIAAIIFTLGVAFCCVAWMTPVAALVAPVLGYFLDALRFVAALFANVPFGTLSGGFVIGAAVVGSCAVMAWLLRTENREKTIANS